MFTTIALWVAKLTGEKLARPITIAVLILLAVLAVFLVARCMGGDNSAQVDQTNASGEAIADAAQGAIETLEGRTATEASIDKAVAETAKNIEGAADADAIRAAVLEGVCGQTSHRNDPACTTTAESRLEGNGP